MTTSDGGADRVTMSQIAELAGVSLPAVSNWKTRRASTGFPEATARGPRGDLYDRAEVLGWLRSRSPHADQRGDEFKVWQVLSSARGLAPVGELLNSVLRALNEPSNPPPGIPDTTWAKLLSDIESIPTSERPTFISTLLDATLGSKAAAGAEHFTPTTLRRLIVELAKPIGDTILDPACGSGSLLASAVDAYSGPTPYAHVFGADINVQTSETAALVLRAVETQAEIRTGDTLAADPFDDLTVATVVCNPPFGMSRQGQSWDPALVASLGQDPSGAGFSGSRAATDVAWLYYAADHLEPGGRGVVVTAQSPLHARAARRWSTNLLRSGAVEAIVALPGGLMTTTSIPLAAWVLRGRTPDTRNDDVLMIDLATTDLPWKSDPDHALAAANAIVNRLRAGEPDEHGARVPVLDLMDADVPWTPTYWTTQASRPDPDSAIDAFQRAQSAVISTLDAMAAAEFSPTTMASGPTPAMATLGELERQGLVTIHRAMPLKLSELGDEGNAVITAASIDNLVARVTGHHPGVAPKAYRTRAGDVVFASVGPRPRAGVVEADGAVIGGSVYAISQDPHRPVLPPRLLAAVMSAPEVASLSTGAAITRVQVREIAIPLLPPDEAQAADRHLAQLAVLQVCGAQLAEHTTSAINAVVTAARAGAHPASTRSGESSGVHPATSKERR